MGNRDDCCSNDALWRMMTWPCKFHSFGWVTTVKRNGAKRWCLLRTGKCVVTSVLRFHFTEERVFSHFRNVYTFVSLSCRAVLENHPEEYIFSCAVSLESSQRKFLLDQGGIWLVGDHESDIVLPGCYWPARWSWPSDMGVLPPAKIRCEVCDVLCLKTILAFYLKLST